MTKEDFNIILDSYNFLNSKINYIADKILCIGCDLDCWKIYDNEIELQWTEVVWGCSSIEYESIPINFLTLNSYKELKDAWQKVKDERAELRRKEKEKKEKREKEEQEKKEKILYEQLKAKYGE